MICFTIGHSDHEPGHFLSLLRKYQIDSLVDIRSTPYSQRVPQFNKEVIARYLKDHGIVYVHFGNRLGGRYTDPGLLFGNGKVDFGKVSRTGNFVKGIEQVIRGVKEGRRIALMCSEKDPFDCHRFLLVAWELERRGVAVDHILEGGEHVSNNDLKRKLLEKYKVEHDQLLMFTAGKTEEEALEEARRRRNLEIGYAPRSPNGDKDRAS